MTTPSLEAMGTARVPRRVVWGLGPRGECMVHGYPGVICGDRGCRGGGRSGDGRLGGGGFSAEGRRGLRQETGVLWGATGDGDPCFGVIWESAPVKGACMSALCASVL